MPVVKVKGTDQQIQFPDDMSPEQILDVMRNQYRPPDYGSALRNNAYAAPYNPTLTERIGSGIGNALHDTGIISDRYGANRIGENVTNMLGALPGLGDAMGGDDFGRALRQGDAMGVGMGALSAVPVVGDLTQGMRRFYHTSPEEISKIDKSGKFGSNLFFSDEPYFMTEAAEPKVYAMDLNEDDLLEVSRLPYMDLTDEQSDVYKRYVEDIKDRLSIEDDELAEELLTESEDVYSVAEDLGIEPEDLADASWEIQRLIGDMASAMGFKGALATDEQGEVLISNMLNREGELKLTQE